MMADMNKTDLAWAAGFVDGEGCFHISIVPVKRCNADRYDTFLSVANTNLQALLKLQKMFGGLIWPIKKYKPQHRQAFEWKPGGGKAAAKVTRALLPFLIAKRDEAKLLIEWHERCLALRATHVQRLTKKEVRERKAMVLAMRRMKRVEYSL